MRPGEQEIINSLSPESISMITSQAVTFKFVPIALLFGTFKDLEQQLGRSSSRHNFIGPHDTQIIWLSNTISLVWSFAVGPSLVDIPEKVEVNYIRSFILFSC